MIKTTTSMLYTHVSFSEPHKSLMLLIVLDQIDTNTDQKWNKQWLLVSEILKCITL